MSGSTKRLGGARRVRLELAVGLSALGLAASAAACGRLADQVSVLPTTSAGSGPAHGRPLDPGRP
ncbi:MAG TPA: hypothetical protein VGJ41_14955, partial [Nocardioides sp.]